jgi:hypothetical protein
MILILVTKTTKTNGLFPNFIHLTCCCVLLKSRWQQVQRECGSRHPKDDATPLQRLAGLLVQLMENWRRYRLYLTDHGAELGVPATNNLTEQMIGNGKVRSRTVRGYKSRAGILAAFMVCAARLV